MPLLLFILGIPENPRDRSPSPEPIYNNQGVRINTRIDRTKNKLINQRNSAITKLKEIDPEYQPPSAYKYKNATLEEKVMIPADVSVTISHKPATILYLLVIRRVPFHQEYCRMYLYFTYCLHRNTLTSILWA